MNTEFKDLLLETLRAVKDHPTAQSDGIGFVTVFDEEPDWEVVISFVPKGLRPDDDEEDVYQAPSTDTRH
jgi:hypothetical protein